MRKRAQPGEPSNVWRLVVGAIARVIVGGRRRNEVTGDLIELRRCRVENGRRDLARATARDLLGLMAIARWRSWSKGGLGMGQDFTYAVRSWRARPAAAATAILTLAVGIGAGALIFTAAHALLLRPLPFPEPEQLVAVSNGPIRVGRYPMVSPTFTQLPEIAAAGVMQAGGVNLDDGGAGVRMRAAVVDDGFFEVMAVPAAVGTTLPPIDGVSRNVVVSWRTWRAHLGGDRGHVGQPLTINGRLYTVVGVMPPDFGFPVDTDVWVPAGVDLQATGTTFAPDLVARLAPGISVERATQAMRGYVVAMYAAAGQPPPDDESLPVVEPLGQNLTRSVRPTVVLLSISVGVLLIAVCVSLANVLLARVASREQELGVRRALGASRWRLARQLLVEGLVLAFAGGAAGMLLAIWGLGALPSLVGDLGIDMQSGFVARLSLVVAGLSGLVAVIMSVAPGLVMSSRISGLVRSGRGAGGGGWQPLRRGLMVAQMTVAVLLLTASTAAVRALIDAAQIDPGFGNTQTVGAAITLPIEAYPYDRVVPFVDQVLERLRSTPGVNRAAVTGMLPGSREVGAGFRISVPGVESSEPVHATYLSASTDYFSTMGNAVLSGRGIVADDRTGAPRVMVLSDSAARRLFAKASDAVGQTVHLSSPRGPRPYTVVGVVADVLMYGLDASPRRRSQMYVAFAQEPPFGTVSLVVDSERSVVEVGEAIAAAVTAIDRSVPVYGVHQVDAVIDRYLRGHRTSGFVVSAFAVVTLVVAAIGLYGLVSQTVSARLPELGIRLALGAEVSGLRWHLARHAALLALTGAVIGTAASAGGMRMLVSYVPGLVAPSLGVVVANAAVLLSVAVLAAWWPTAPIRRLDPASILRK